MSEKISEKVTRLQEELEKIQQKIAHYDENEQAWLEHYQQLRREFAITDSLLQEARLALSREALERKPTEPKNQIKEMIL